MCRHPSYFVGLLLKEARLPYNNYGHVVLAKPSPILFYPISSVEVSLYFSTTSTVSSMAQYAMHYKSCGAVLYIGLSYTLWADNEVERRYAGEMSSGCPRGEAAQPGQRGPVRVSHYPCGK